MAGKSLADKLASLANPEPVFHDPEAEDDVTAAKVAAWKCTWRRGVIRCNTDAQMNPYVKSGANMTVVQILLTF